MTYTEINQIRKLCLFNKISYHSRHIIEMHYVVLYSKNHPGLKTFSFTEARQWIDQCLAKA